MGGTGRLFCRHAAAETSPSPSARRCPLPPKEREHAHLPHTTHHAPHHARPTIYSTHPLRAQENPTQPVTGNPSSRGENRGIKGGGEDQSSKKGGSAHIIHPPRNARMHPPSRAADEKSARRGRGTTTSARHSALIHPPSPSPEPRTRARGSKRATEARTQQNQQLKARTTARAHPPIHARP
jgi:hypothetical protein